MSIMEILMVPQGIVVATDRTITHQPVDPTARTSFSTRPKAFKWYQNDLAIIAAYVGRARIRDMPTDEYLHRFFGRHSVEGDGRIVAEALGACLDRDYPRTRDAGSLVVHFAHFEWLNDAWVPHVWFVHNTHDLSPEGEYAWSAGNPFLVVDVQDPTPAPDRREAWRVRSEALDPVWIQHGSKLRSFHAIKVGYRMALRALIDIGELDAPVTIEDWAGHARAVVLAYGAFFEALFEPHQRVVGGGADALWIEWPLGAPVAGQSCGE